jgi:hypothetical protein
MTYNQENWEMLVLEVSKKFRVTADFDFMLFLIGVHELGQGMREYSRNEKMDLINLGECILLERCGYLEFKENDQQGWPQFAEKEILKTLSFSFLNHELKRAAFNYYTNQLSINNQL